MPYLYNVQVDEKIAKKDVNKINIVNINGVQTAQQCPNSAITSRRMPEDLS